MICKILGLFVNELTADDKYSLLNTDNLMQRIQIILSKELKTFSVFFLFLKYRSSFEDFEKKDDPHSLWILLNRDFERRG